MIYKARRGLKELDFYLDHYIKQGYLNADTDEQAAFARLLACEDPELLLYFLGQATPDGDELVQLIAKIKHLKHQDQ